MRPDSEEQGMRGAEQTLAGLAAGLGAGRTTSRTLVEDCLARITDQDGEGARAFI